MNASVRDLKTYDIHTKLAIDPTTDELFVALRRFVSQRGKFHKIYMTKGKI